VSSAIDLPRAGALARASDGRLTSLVRQGNREAFTTLYERHRALVDAVARASSRERAEDISQEAWTSAYRALSGPGKPIEHAAPWLAAIARNVARDRARRDKRQPEVVNDEIVAAAPAPGGVESALEGKHNIGRLLGAFDELPEEQQLILNLREFGGLTYKQIAEQLGKPESTIEAALFRARRKMVKEYAELISGRRCRIAQSQLLTGAQLSHGERRRLTRHLGRCASCERVARLEGADHLIPAPRMARIAGTIPVPAAVARLFASGADAVGPLAGKAAAAAVVVVAGAGVLALEQDGGTDRVGPGSDAADAAATAGASGQQVALSAAPHVVRLHRVSTLTKRKATGGSTTTASVRPTTTAGASTPVAGAAPRPPATTKADPPRKVSSDPVERAPQQPAAQGPVVQQPASAAPVAGPVAPAPAAPAPQPAAPATQPVQQAPTPATPARQQATNQGGSTPTPRVQAPASQGPSVTQTPTCLVADCSIGP
jgi:RNA polymerase sigma factor (sigma-70 family)